MKKFILGKKVEMTHKYNENGERVPVTIVQAGPCTVTQIKQVDKDGYLAVQIAYDEVKKLNKAESGHLAKIGKLFRFLREFRVNELDEDIDLGKEITVSIFEKGDKINVTGRSKGKGFQGVVKRHGFGGGPASHGHKDQLRMSGSVGATGNARVFKGTRMGGHTGNAQITIKNLEIVDVDPEKNLLYIKGSIPGSRNSLVKIISA